VSTTGPSGSELVTVQAQAPPAGTDATQSASPVPEATVTVSPASPTPVTRTGPPPIVRRHRAR